MKQLILTVVGFLLLFSIVGCTAQTDPTTGRSFDGVVLSVNGGAAYVEMNDGTQQGVMNPFPETKKGDKVRISTQSHESDCIAEVVK